MSTSIQSPVSFEFISGERPAVRSLELAQHFGLKHKNVLRDIRDLMGKLPESFCRLNFEPADIEVLVPASGGLRKDPAYLLTRDAFTLLVMGWSSARAMEWKLRYIEAFNALERAAMENARAEARIEGASGFMALSQEQRNDLEKAIYYRNKGLSFEDVGKLLDRSRDYVWRLLRRAVDLGLADAGLIAPLPKHQRLDAGRPACPVASREGA